MLCTEAGEVLDDERPSVNTCVPRVSVKERGIVRGRCTATMSSQRYLLTGVLAGLRQAKLGVKWLMWSEGGTAGAPVRRGAIVCGTEHKHGTNCTSNYNSQAPESCKAQHSHCLDKDTLDRATARK